MKTQNNDEILKTLKDRFHKNPNRHTDVSWVMVQEKLEKSPEKLKSLSEMENTGGEPDVVIFNKEIVFCDCSAETPSGRRNVCYDRTALEFRKEHKPKNSATDMASAMGIELLTEDEYRELQTVGKFDLKTSSWIKTPTEVRKLGGALFADFRYGRVFVYHNGAESYYAVRGFRGLLRV